MLDTQIKKLWPQMHDDYMQRIAKHPQGEWLTPTGDDFSFFSQLAEYHLVMVRRIPLWQNNALHGTETQFLYRDEMDFKAMIN